MPSSSPRPPGSLELTTAGRGRLPWACYALEDPARAGARQPGPPGSPGAPRRRYGQRPRPASRQIFSGSRPPRSPWPVPGPPDAARFAWGRPGARPARRGRTPPGYVVPGPASGGPRRGRPKIPEQNFP